MYSYLTDSFSFLHDSVESRFYNNNNNDNAVYVALSLFCFAFCIKRCWVTKFLKISR